MKKPLLKNREKIGVLVFLEIHQKTHPYTYLHVQDKTHPESLRGQNSKKLIHVSTYGCYLLTCISFFGILACREGCVFFGIVLPLSIIIFYF